MQYTFTATVRNLQLIENQQLCLRPEVPSASQGVHRRNPLSACGQKQPKSIHKNATFVRGRQNEE
jgi:hypothetical protein